MNGCTLVFLLREQVVLSEQGEFFMTLLKRAGCIKQAGWDLFERTRLIKISLGQKRVNGVLILQSDQRGVLLVSVGSLGCLLSVPAPKGPGFYV